MKGFVGGIPIALLAVAAQAMEHGADHSMGNGVEGRGPYPQAGGTAMGGPSGNDHDGSFTSPFSAHINAHTTVNEYSKDDHSIDVKHKDVYPPPPPPIPYGVAMAPGMGPFGEGKKRHYEPNGGTVIGGPSGDDEGQVFNMPITGNFHTDVSESNKDDHSIKIKDKHVHPPPFPHPPFPHGPPNHPPFPHPPDVAGPPPGHPLGGIGPGPGPGFHGGPPHQNPKGQHHVPGRPFAKRWGPEVGGTAMGGPGGGSAPEDFPASFVAGGTAMGGPSGDDDGIEFETGAHADVHTNVNEHYHDDHSVDLKHTDIYPPPPPVPFGPPGFGPHFKRGWAPEHGGTAMGGPSGDDDGIEFETGAHADVHSNVNEHHNDDHSVHLKHTDIYPPPPPVPFGPPGFGPHFKRGWAPEHGGTVMGGPSGDDGGQEFNMPITVDTHTNVHEEYEDDHSIDLKHKDVYPPPPIPPTGGPGPFMPKGGVTPFRRAYSPSSTERTGGGGGGGTAMGGPSGEDDGINFGSPNSVEVDSDVNEHHEDNHAIKAESTDVHAVPHMPWMSYHGPPPPRPAGVPQGHHGPPPGRHDEAPACHPQVHEVVRTVTKTHTRVLHPTETVNQPPAEHVHDTVTVTETPKAHVVQATETVYVTPTAHAAQTSAIPMSAIPNEVVASKILYSSQAAQFASTPAMPSSSAYKYSQRPMSSGAAYSMIPIHVPAATPASSSMSMPKPSGVDPIHSQMASASASPSPGVLFTGAAPRLSGGIASAAAAVMGVLAFIL